MQKLKTVLVRTDAFKVCISSARQGGQLPCIHAPGNLASAKLTYIRSPRNISDIPINRADKPGTR